MSQQGKTKTRSLLDFYK